MQYLGLTDIGRVRKQNQDFFFAEGGADGKWALLVVCDGMGGAKSGNIASRLSCEAFTAKMLSEPFHDVL